jgi:hypothetical protein
VRVFLIDGTFKTFLVKKSDTVHSFKDQIAKKLKVDPTVSSQYGLYVLTDNRRGKLATELNFCKPALQFLLALLQ